MKFQGFGPFGIAITKDGQYAYLSFDLSEDVCKVRLEDLTVEATADLSEYFPMESELIALDASEGKLFVYTLTWQKLLVLNTHTMSVIHTIDDIDIIGMIRSQYGPVLITWNGGNTVKFINTETFEVTEFMDSDTFFLKIQESDSIQGLWYVVSAQESGSAEVNVGIYSHESKTWSRNISLPPEAQAGNVFDLKILPNEQKAYVAIFGGWYPEYHAYGWLHSVDLVSEEVKVIPIDGGVMCLEASVESRFLYVGTGWPKPSKTSENNLLVVDTQTDTIVDQIYLNKTKFGWSFTQMNVLQIDPSNPNLLYATCADANAFIKVDLDRLSPVDVVVLNEERYRPHYFTKQTMKTTGFIFVHQSSNAFELDINDATIKGVVELPMIRADAYAYDGAINDAGRMFIAQGEKILEVELENMLLHKIHPLPKEISGLWHFVLSKDGTKIYSLWPGPTSGGWPPDTFLAISSNTFQVEAKFKLEGGGFNSRPFELPDGSKLYALGGQQNGPVVIQVIDTDDYTIQKTITFDEQGSLGITTGPYYPFAYDSSSHTLFAGATHVVLAIDTDKDVIKKVIYLGDAARAIGLEPWQLTYINTTGLVYNPQENYLYIAHLDRSFVSIYNLNNDQFLPQAISLKGYFPNFLFANDDYSNIYSLNRRSDNVTVIDVNSKLVEKVIDLQIQNTTSIQTTEEIPGEFYLSQNYPNPFNTTTTFEYIVPCGCRASLKVYNSSGQLVATLKNETKLPGRYSAVWDASGMPSGIYFCTLIAGNFAQTKSILFLK
ncbi:T9SS type A sorting domain-containing protein [Candidatus Latescibacterota bacterium]